jgi:hypothetical protein
MDDLCASCPSSIVALFYAHDTRVTFEPATPFDIHLPLSRFLTVEFADRMSTRNDARRRDIVNSSRAHVDECCATLCSTRSDSQETSCARAFDIERDADLVTATETVRVTQIIERQLSSRSSEQTQPMDAAAVLDNEEHDARPLELLMAHVRTLVLLDGRCTGTNDEHRTV